MKKYVGIDLGGTNVRVAIINEKGELLEELKRPSLSDQGPEIVLNNIIDMIRTLRDWESCQGIGIGIPGPVDVERGCVTVATNIKGFEEFPVVDYMKKHFDMPIYLDNDANVAGLAEAIVGSGRGKRIVYYVTHSTGIGGALIVNGQVVSGRYGYAGEIANIIVDPSRERFNHLNAGAVENWASGDAIVRQGRELISEDINSAYDVFLLAQDGHQVANEIIDTMVEYFATMLSAIGHVVDPHVFVLGGGVSLSHEFYLDRVIARYQELVHGGMKSVEFKLASLEEPGIIGAAMLCYSNED